MLKSSKRLTLDSCHIITNVHESISIKYILLSSITPTGGGGGMLAPDGQDFHCKLFVSVANFYTKA